MKSIGLTCSLFLVLSLGVFTAGCASSSDAPTAVSDADVVEGSTRLTAMGRIKPDELAREIHAVVKEELDRCLRPPAGVTTIDWGNFDGLVRDACPLTSGSTVEFMMRAAERIPLATLDQALGEWTDRWVKKMVDDGDATLDRDGYYETKPNVSTPYAKIERTLRDEKTFEEAQPVAAGKPLAAVRDMWTGAGTNFYWLAPARVSGDAPLTEAEVRFFSYWLDPDPPESYGWSPESELASTGKAAVDAFAEDTRTKHQSGWSDLAAFLKSDAIKEQWYFERASRTASGANDTMYFLLVRDEKNQLWGGFTRF